MNQNLYNLYEAKTALSSLVDRAAAGEEITIAKAGRPMVRLISVHQIRKPRKPGGWKGRVRIAKGFDDPLPQKLLRAFEGQ